MTEQLLTAMYLEDPIGDLMIAGNSLSQSLLSLLVRTETATATFHYFPSTTRPISK